MVALWAGAAVSCAGCCTSAVPALWALQTCGLPHFVCFSVPVVSRGVMGLEMVVGRSDGGWHRLFSTSLSKLIWFNTFLNHDGSVTISQIHTGAISGKYWPSGGRAECSTARWDTLSSRVLKSWSEMQWHGV